MALKQKSYQLKNRLLYFITSIIFIWAALVFYLYSPYFSQYLDYRTKELLLILASAYTLYSITSHLLRSINTLSNSKSRLAFNVLARCSKAAKTYLKRKPQMYSVKIFNISKEEKNVLLFGLVKFIFIPIMLDFLVNNIDGIISSFTNLNSLSGRGLINGFNNLVFPAALALLLLIDTAFFSFGYIFESTYLGNRVKSVDPTFLGWFVALVCYPPLNSTFTKLTNWHSDDYAIFHSNKATFALRLVTIFLMAIYAYASVSLGSKASNLTNRGIVGSGAYKYVRHPAYISKNLVWWLTLLPVISFAAVLSMACWSFIYFMRAITEERHLSADPDYLAYCDKVKYRFIPGVF